MEKKRKIQDKLPEIKRDLPYSIPENYFDNFNDRLYARINEESEAKTLHSGKTLRYAWITGLAAMLTGIIFFAHQAIYQPSTVELSSDEIAYVLEQEIYDLDEFGFEDKIIEAKGSFELTQQSDYDEEVIQYLLDENIELESIVNEL